MKRNARRTANSWRTSWAGGRRVEPGPRGGTGSTRCIQYDEGASAVAGPMREWEHLDGPAHKEAGESEQVQRDERDDRAEAAARECASRSAPPVCHTCCALRGSTAHADTLRVGACPSARCALPRARCLPPASSPAAHRSRGGLSALPRDPWEPAFFCLLVPSSRGRPRWSGKGRPTAWHTTAACLFVCLVACVVLLAGSVPAALGGTGRAVCLCAPVGTPRRCR